MAPGVGIDRGGGHNRTSAYDRFDLGLQLLCDAARTASAVETYNNMYDFSTLLTMASPETSVPSPMGVAMFRMISIASLSAYLEVIGFFDAHFGALGQERGGTILGMIVLLGVESSNVLLMEFVARFDLHNDPVALETLTHIVNVYAPEVALGVSTTALVMLDLIAEGEQSTTEASMANLASINARLKRWSRDHFNYTGTLFLLSKRCAALSSGVRTGVVQALLFWGRVRRLGAPWVATTSPVDLLERAPANSANAAFAHIVLALRMTTRANNGASVVIRAWMNTHNAEMMHWVLEKATELANINSGRVHRGADLTSALQSAEVGDGAQMRTAVSRRTVTTAPPPPSAGAGQGASTSTGASAGAGAGVGAGAGAGADTNDDSDDEEMAACVGSGPASELMAARVVSHLTRAMAKLVGGAVDTRVEVLKPAHFLAADGKTALPEAAESFLCARYMDTKRGEEGVGGTRMGVAYTLDATDRRAAAVAGKYTDSDSRTYAKLFVVGAPKRGDTTHTQTESGWLPGRSRKGWALHDAPLGWHGTVAQAWNGALQSAEGCTCATAAEKLECRCSTSIEHAVPHQGRPLSAKHLTVDDSVDAATQASSATRWSRRMHHNVWARGQGVTALQSAAVTLHAAGETAAALASARLMDVVAGTPVLCTAAAADAGITLHSHIHERGVHTVSQACVDAHGSTWTAVAFTRLTPESLTDGVEALAFVQEAASAVGGGGSAGIDMAGEDMSPSLAAFMADAAPSKEGSGLYAWATGAGLAWAVNGTHVTQFPADPRCLLVVRPHGSAWLLQLHRNATKAQARRLSLPPLQPLPMPGRVCPSAHGVFSADTAATVSTQLAPTAAGSATSAGTGTPAVACITIRDASGVGIEHASCTMQSLAACPVAPDVVYHPHERAVCFGFPAGASDSHAVPNIVVVRKELGKAQA